MNRLLHRAIGLVLMGCILSPRAVAQRPTPPARDPHTPGYVEAKELPDGEVPPADADGNFIIGPTHTAGAGDDRRGRRAAGRSRSSSR